jgi:uroporphyrinogen-III decarboxylase
LGSGGVDTQKTLPFGTSDQVYDEVRRRIDIFTDGGGFVFNTIHNIQAGTPLENLPAAFRAIRDSGGKKQSTGDCDSVGGGSIFCVYCRE